MYSFPSQAMFQNIRKKRN